MAVRRRSDQHTDSVSASGSNEEVRTCPNYHLPFDCIDDLRDAGGDDKRTAAGAKGLTISNANGGNQTP